MQQWCSSGESCRLRGPSSHNAAHCFPGPDAAPRQTYWGAQGPAQLVHRTISRSGPSFHNAPYNALPPGMTLSQGRRTGEGPAQLVCRTIIDPPISPLDLRTMLPHNAESTLIAWPIRHRGRFSVARIIDPCIPRYHCGLCVSVLNVRLVELLYPEVRRN